MTFPERRNCQHHFFFHQKNINRKFPVKSENRLIPCFAEHASRIWLYYSQAKTNLKGMTG